MGLRQSGQTSIHDPDRLSRHDTANPGDVFDLSDVGAQEL